MDKIKTTGDLERDLKGHIDLSQFLKENKDSFLRETIGEILQGVIAEKKLNKSAVARDAQMSEIYFFQILSGRRTPSRDRLLCLCFAMKCTFNETQEILKHGRYSLLYVKNRRDAIITFGLKKGWSLVRINEELFFNQEQLLC